jgi:hypothetical protein
MSLTDITRRDWLLLAALTCVGPFWFAFVRVYASIAGGFVLEWSGVGPGFPARTLLTAVGSLGSVVAAAMLMQLVTRYALRPLPLAAGLALLVPLVIALGLWIEFNASAKLLLRLLGFEALAFSITCLGLGYRASRVTTDK